MEMLEIKCVILFSVLLSNVGCLLSFESELRRFVLMQADLCWWSFNTGLGPAIP